MREPNSGALRSRWTSGAPPGKKPDQGDRACEFGPEKDSRKPSSIRTYPVVKLSLGGACGQIGKIISSWKLVGRVTPDGRYRDFRPLPGVRVGRQTSALASGEPGNPPQAANAARQPGDGTGPAAFRVAPRMTRCDECGAEFASRARRSSSRPRLYCPTHQYRPGRRAG